MQLREVAQGHPTAGGQGYLEAQLVLLAVAGNGLARNDNPVDDQFNFTGPPGIRSSTRSP
jgi:hypothetical protein